METSFLERIGLTKNESIVYITLLRTGLTTTGNILKNSGLNSGKIYEILESLKSKGLVSESIINNVKHYDASPSIQIIKFLENKKQEIDNDKLLIKSKLNEIDKFRNIKTNESLAKTYTGFDGIKTAAYEAIDSLKFGEEILGMGITELKDKKFNDFWLRFGEERVKRKIKARHIYSERGSYVKSYKNIKYTEHRILEGITPVTIDIFGKDKVLILNYTAPYSYTLIIDKNTATSFINFFNQLWKIAKK